MTFLSKVSTLSGGERGRLALAKLSLTHANLLLLDEPTNHLDIPSQEILQEVLDQYQGTILLVSHDRYLIDALGSQIWEILPGQAMLQVFEGTYTQYKEYQVLHAEQSGKVSLAQEPTPRKARPVPLSPEQKKRRSRLKEVEARIAFLENELQTLSHRLENPPPDLAQVQKLGRAYASDQEELDHLMAEWEGLHEQTAPA